MSELLFSISPLTPPHVVPSSAHIKCSPLSDVMKTDKRIHHHTPTEKVNRSHSTPVNQQSTPRHEEQVKTPEEELTRAPSKQPLTTEEAHKSINLSVTQLKFDNGISLQSISKANKENLSENIDCGLFCEKKDNSFVPLMPKGGPGQRRRKGLNGKKRHSVGRNFTPADTTQNNCIQITPKKGSMPQVHGSNVTLESPDPMSKYNSNNQASSELQKLSQKNKRVSSLLMDCKKDLSSTTSPVPRLDLKSVETLATIRTEASKLLNKNNVTVSPDAVTQDIYDFDTCRKKVGKVSNDSIECCRYEIKGSDALERTQSMENISDAEESQLTARVHAVRHKSVRIMEKPLTRRRSLSPSLNTLEKELKERSSHSKELLPTSRSLDTLHPRTPLLVAGTEQVALKPTPPSRSARCNSFHRKSPPKPSSTSPTLTESQACHIATPPCNKEVADISNIRRGGRRYTNPISPVEEERQEDIISPPTESHALDRRFPKSCGRNSQPSSPAQRHIVQIDYCIKSPLAADIPHPSPKKKKGDRSVTVSGFSKQFLVSLITAASKKRRKRSKNQPAFSIKLEKIPEDDYALLGFPKWVAPACGVVAASNVMTTGSMAEKTPQQLEAEIEYRDWLQSQIRVVKENENTPNNSSLSAIDELMLAIQSHDNEKFKDLLNENKNIIFARDSNGNTALIAATLFGWKRGIKNLIKRGADLDAQNRFGNTSLHYASAFGEHKEIRRYLIRKQASLTIRNERGICCSESTL